MPALSGRRALNLQQVLVRPVEHCEEGRYRQRMQAHHYLGALPGEGDEEAKQTNDIKMAIPLLDAVDIQGTEITADALLTQRKLAEYVGEDRKAHDHFTVKGNQPRLRDNIALYFQNRQEPDFIDHARLRCFAVGIIKSKGVSNVAQKLRQLHRSTRLVLDYLRMTENSCATNRAVI